MKSDCSVSLCPFFEIFLTHGHKMDMELDNFFFDDLMQVVERDMLSDTVLRTEVGN